MKKNQIAVLFLGSILAMLAITAFVFAPLMGPPFESLEGLVLWLATGGGAGVIAAIVVTLLLENWPTWHTLPLWVKVGFPIVVQALIAAIFQIVLGLDLLTRIPTGVQVLILALLNWLFSQFALMRSNAVGYASTAKSKAISMELAKEAKPL